MHKSAGAIIKNKQGEILLIERKKFPFGWACPAGHIEEGESPEEAIQREVKEETGLQVIKYKLLIHKYISWNECSRGAKGHDWFVFSVSDFQGDLQGAEKEVKDIKWLKISKLKNYQLEEVWKMWFEKLKIL